MAMPRTTAALFLSCAAAAVASCRHESADFSADVPGVPALAAPSQPTRIAPVEIPVERLRLQALVGKVFGDSIPFPEVSTYLGGWIIDSAPGSAIAVEERSVAGRHVLLLDSLLGRSPARHPTWLILDAIRLPDAGDSVELNVHCGYEATVQDRRLIALVWPIDAYEVTAIRAAWRVNRATRRFEAAPLVGLRCWNEGWGQ